MKWKALFYFLMAVFAGHAGAYEPSLIKMVTHAAQAYQKERTNHGVTAEMSVTKGQPNPACPEFQSFGFPDTTDHLLLRRAFYLCRGGYAGMFDPAEKSSLWIAERLKAGQISGGEKRAGIEFVQDPQIPLGAQASPDDYRHSSFDRGHMAPAGDFGANRSGMAQSFFLSNIVPQNPANNRGIWANLEGAVREMAERRGELFVLTGPVYSERSQRLFKGRQVSGGEGVMIPDALYKVIIDQKRTAMTAFIIPNRADVGEDPVPYQTTVRAVEKATRLNFNPSLSRSEADRLETKGGDWVFPKVRVKFRD